MKVLLTGGAGFIGSNVSDRLLASGHKVVIVDNLSSGKEENVPEDATFYKLDIRDEELAEVFEKEQPDVVDHHAAQMSVVRSVEDPMYDGEVNVLGSLRLMEHSRKVGVKKFIYASTGGAVYGDPEELPATESTPLRPLCPYGISKHTVEHYLELYQRTYGIDYVVLRYPNVYGPRQDPHGEAGVVAIFNKRILHGERPTIFGDGTKTRDYVFVGDIVEANMLALASNYNGILNLGRGAEVTDYQVFEAVRDALGAEIEPIYAEKRPGEIERICLDSSKAQQVLGWKPKVAFRDGVEQAAQFYKERYEQGRF